MSETKTQLAPSPVAGEVRGGGSTSRHLVRRAGDANFVVPPAFVERSRGFKRWGLIGEESPAVHTGFALCTLDADGWVAPHVHSYEESIFMMEGEAELTTTEGTFLLRAGDYGVILVGVRHSWRGLGTGARWAQMMAPQPRSRLAGDTFFINDSVGFPSPSGGGKGGASIDVRDPRTRSFGHIEPSNMDVKRQTQDQLAVSASMRTALLVYSGITVKMMVDTDLGAELSTMFMVQYEPNGVAGQHDHPLEETYLILEGSVDATFDGERYRMEAGDIAFAGVGCVHGFSNPADRPVRWLETQSPQPPKRHSYRFARDWDYLKTRLSEKPS
jgi:quercetin dioxygenase-like cupin family protein